jgi:catechol 2,3-dioxygenase-like lactoylglutathione lyase family enzyme
MATFRQWFDEEHQVQRVEAYDMQPREEFANPLFEDPHSDYLRIQQGNIVVEVDNGRWIYRPVAFDKARGVVTAEWPD